MVVRQNHDCRQNLPLTPPTAVCIFAEEDFAVLREKFPRLKGQNFVYLGKFGDLGVYCLETMSYPVQVSPTEDKSFLQNLNQVIAVEATDCHNAQVVFNLQREAVFAVDAV